MDKPKKYFYTLKHHSGADSYECDILLPRGAKFIYYNVEYMVINNDLICVKTKDDRTFTPCPACKSPLLDIIGDDNFEKNCLIGYECNYCNFYFKF